MHSQGTRATRPVILAAILAALAADRASAQAVFSVDFGAPPIAIPDCAFGVPITEGDVLGVCTPPGGMPMPGPTAPPFIQVSGGLGPPAPGLGIPLHPGAIGHPPCVPLMVEVDALSYGTDDPLADLFVSPCGGARGYPHGKVLFSVDAFATGVPGSSLAPNVMTEGPFFDQAADVLRSLGLPPFPIPPLPIGNSGEWDGDGLPSGSGFAYPSLGLFEPTAPLPPIGCPPGSNLDALDSEVAVAFPPVPVFPPGGIYFSLDAPFPDPQTGAPNSGSALANGFFGADVLWTPVAGGPPVVYAPAAALGLAPIQDDIDALIILENGIPGWQPSVVPGDWLGGATDMVLFSVRRGSFISGGPVPGGGIIDSILGIPIEEGDILTTPSPVGGPPGILIPAEALGLWTFRSFGPAPPPWGPWGDDLDASDAVRLHDPVTPDCTGDVVACPCGNNTPPGTREGCIHSGGVGMTLRGAPGAGSSVCADDLDILVCQIPLNAGAGPGNSGLFLIDTNNVGTGPVFDGFNCVGGGPRVLPGCDCDNDGCRTTGPFISQTNAIFPGYMVPGTSYWIQYWSRDVLCGPPPAPCPTPCTVPPMTQANFSNAGMVTLTP